ncbi:MAG TPA: ATP-dependent Clp protease adaptor ClpS, partial [Burkholderiales bacterium]|nr:ATP-dependent Clp protease adaptor ClpS [Burkholderiales bacterium]
AAFGSWLWYVLFRQLDRALFGTLQHVDAGKSVPLKATPHSLRGYLKIVTIHGVPVFIHWSFPVGGLLISFWVGFDLEAAAYYCLGYLILVGAHELGHFAAARWSRLNVRAVEISGIGGLCRMEMPRTVGQAFLVYSGGFLAQLLLLILALSYVAAFGSPTSRLAQCLAATFIVVNILVLVANIIPIKPREGVATDGYVLFKLLRGDSREIVAPVDSSPVLPPDTRLLSIEGFVPDGFVSGIEILNDRTTPMEFVVGVLMKDLEHNREQAVEIMLTVHRRGGLLIPVPTFEEATLIAERITLEAREHNHALICRAVNADHPKSEAQSGRRGFLTPGSHNTPHAGPHGVFHEATYAESHVAMNDTQRRPLQRIGDK